MSAARLREVRAEVASVADQKRAEGAARFFKTGPGEYGEGDKFLGITVPALRKIARGARDLSLDDLLKLLHSTWHEERLLALMVMVEQHARGAERDRAALHRAYLANTKRINNWDLVDASAGEVVGHHVAEKGTRFLERLAKSSDLWERRIAMIATFYCIKQNEFAPTLLIAEQLLDDDHDLIHKAVGWMLREVGKRDVAVLRRFLDLHAAAMPRTALRYSIERFTSADRQRYMAMKYERATASSAKASTKRPRRSKA